MSRRGNFLDADDNILEKNLKFVKNEFEEDLKQFFGGGSDGPKAPPRDYKVVTPVPGMCIKTFKVNTNEKFFINVCQTEDIPAPEDITDEQLEEILQSDAPSSFRIPMSISETRITKDKSNNPVDVCDIAINPQFFAKIGKSLLFKEFFLTLIGEALSDKYNVQIKPDKCIILNNRKFIGTLVSHRVRNTDIKTVLESYKSPTESDKMKMRDLESKSGGDKKSRLVQEIDDKDVRNIKKQQELRDNQARENAEKFKPANEPEYKLRAKFNGEKVEEILAEFHLPKCITFSEMTLDIGEDRILLESMKHGYIFDKFVNYRLNQERAGAIFDKNSKMLQVRVPVIH